jgi:Nif-specific regulatory protein
MTDAILDPGRSAREIRRLTTLHEVSRALSGTLHVASALQGALEVLEQHHRMAAVAVVLQTGSAGSLEVKAATQRGVGTRPSAARDPLVRRVIESARPVVVERAGDEPLLERRRARGRSRDADLTVICLPLVLDDAPVGAVRVELPFKAERNYDRLVWFYRVVASMMGEALRLARLVDVERRRLAGEPVPSEDEAVAREAWHRLIGAGAAMARVHEQVQRVARSIATVLLLGESGTGKELVAEAIHRLSPRRRGPFVKVSCAALPESLLESELFGYERGAFTGAHAPKKGRFELAHGGTLFLDEIGELSAATQVKLLRVLQEREIERLGGTAPVKLDVRLVAATHRPLEQLVQAGAFRHDLYYRLNVFSITVPPLRDRRTDIPLLADHFLERFSREHGRAMPRLSLAALEMLAAYDWPGNVRELQNTIERAVLLCTGATIHGHHLPPAVQTAAEGRLLAATDLAAEVGAFERQLIEQTLAAARGNSERAARLLNTTPRIIRYKIRKYGIESSPAKPR